MRIIFPQSSPSATYSRKSWLHCHFYYYHFSFILQVEYCNSLLLLTVIVFDQLALYSSARAAIRTSQFQQITSILESLHWILISQRIRYIQLLSLTNIYKKTGMPHPSYLRSLLSLLPHRSTHSSSLVTLDRPSVSSGMNILTR